MATSYSFTTYKAQIASYLERGGSLVTDQDVTEQIPFFINSAERKIMTALKLQGSIEVLADPVGLRTGLSVISKPDRWRQTVSFSFGSGANSNTRGLLLPRAYEVLRNYWPDDAQVGVPAFYADYDYQHWLVAPTPDTTYPIEVLCYSQPQFLDEQNQTNFFSNYTPELLLYGALLESAPYLKADERLQTWAGLWQQQLGMLDGQDLQRILDRSSQRSRP